MSDTRDHHENEAAVSPKNPVAGRVTPQEGPMEPAGTEAEEAAPDNSPSGEKRERSDSDPS